MHLQNTLQFAIRSKLETNTKAHLNSSLKMSTENPWRDCAASQASSTGPRPRFRWTGKPSGTSQQCQGWWCQGSSRRPAEQGRQPEAEAGSRREGGEQEAEPSRSFSNQSVLKWTGREQCEKGKVRAFVIVFCWFHNRWLDADEEPMSVKSFLNKWICSLRFRPCC